MHKLMKDGQMNDISSLRRRDGTCTTTPIETLTELINTLIPSNARDETDYSCLTRITRASRDSYWTP